MKTRQVFRKERFARGDTNVRKCQPIDDAAWIWMPGHTLWGIESDCADAWSINPPQKSPIPVFKFRCVFTSDGTPLLFDVSADERYILRLDGEVISRGPHRGMIEHWYYHTYQIDDLEAGAHTLEAICWQLGSNAPLAQLSLRGGFILKADGSYDDQLTTGKSPWQVAPLEGLSMGGTGTSGSFGVGTECTVSGTSYMNALPAEGAWVPAATIRPPVVNSGYGARTKGWMLFPTQRPDMLYRSCLPGRVVNTECDITKPIPVPANTVLDLWWNLENYYCAYPELNVSGGKNAVITWGWTESLCHPDGAKGNRNEWIGKEFAATLTDTFLCDGRQDACFTTPWWRCGKWCRVTVKTQDEPLLIQRISIGETHYPLEFDASFSCSDESLDAITAICRRTMLMCMHEMMFDCPFYEQQMYPGDTRLELNILNALSRDERMQRFVMSIFNLDRRDNGMVAMNFPTRGTQESATYTMCWILMFKDFLMWHDNPDFLKSQMPGVRNALMGLELYENQDGLLENLPGWSFMDWVYQRFDNGVAPNGNSGQGVSSLNNLFYLLSIKAVIDIESALGESHYAARWQEKASLLARKINALFWDETAGMIADTTAHDCYSEHAQCLAILADVLSTERQARAFNALLTEKNLAPVSSYFAFYLFEAYFKCGRSDLILARLDAWREFIKLGSSTAFEIPHTTTRSDCHAWSTSPLYFYQTALAGVLPDAPFFGRVRIAPQPAGLRHIAAETPCPQGIIKTIYDIDSDRISAVITLPGTLEGTFCWNGQTLPLKPGEQRVNL